MQVSVFVKHEVELFSYTQIYANLYTLPQLNKTRSTHSSKKTRFLTQNIYFWIRLSDADENKRVIKKLKHLQF